MIMDSKTFLMYARQGNFLKLDQMKQNFTEEVRFVTASSNTSKHEQAYGIEIGKNHRLQNSGFNTKNKVLGIVANSKHTKAADQFVKWLIEP